MQKKALLLDKPEKECDVSEQLWQAEMRLTFGMKNTVKTKLRQISLRWLSLFYLL